MSKTKAIEMLESIIALHSLCGMRKAELQEVIDELRGKSLLEDADVNRDISGLKEVAYLMEKLKTLERRVKALEEEAAERRDG